MCRFACGGGDGGGLLVVWSSGGVLRFRTDFGQGADFISSRDVRNGDWLPVRCLKRRWRSEVDGRHW